MPSPHNKVTRQQYNTIQYTLFTARVSYNLGPTQCTQEADLVRAICGAQGGYETAEVPDVRRIDGGRGLCGGPGKRMDGVFPG